MGGPGEGIGHAVILAFDELDSVVEFFEFNCLTSLLWLIGADCFEILKVLVVSADLDLVSGASEIMGPVLKGCHNSKEFLLVDCIVLFCQGEFL